MPQVTISIPNKKVPALREFLQVLGIKGKFVSHFPKTNRSQSERSSFSTSSTGSFVNWEYFRNELEFE